jgi:integrase/recombinase XerD
MCLQYCYILYLQKKLKGVTMSQSIKINKKNINLKKTALKKTEVENLLSSINRSNISGSRDYALINLIATTGLRTHEIINAKKGDLINCCGFIILWVQQKNENKSLKLSNKIYIPIYEYLKIVKSESDIDPIFQSHSKKNFGQALTTRSISRIVKNRLKNIGITKKFINTDSLRNSNYKD